MIKFIDLFCGTGGIRLGMEQALDELGISSTCIKSSEIDKKACETYELNFGEYPYLDVHDIDDLEDFNVLLAGFPCQSFSYAGKQLGFTDTRGTLFFEVEKLLKKYKPQLVFLENVRGLTTHDQGRTFKTILDSLERIGYGFQYRLLNSSNYGIPQNRVRIYIVGILNANPVMTLPNDLGACDSHDFARYSSQLSLFSDYSFKRVRDILDTDPDQKYNCSEDFVSKLNRVLNGDFSKLHGVRLIDTRNGNSIHSWDIGIKGNCTNEEIHFMNMLIANRRKHIFGVYQDGKALTKEQISTFYTGDDIDYVISGLLDKGYLSIKEGKYNPVCGNMSFEVFKFLDPDSISITLTASDSHKLGVYYNDRVRRITPRECARLQGYPNNYMLHPDDKYAYKQMGNAVSVPVIKHIFLDVMKNNPCLL